MPRRPPDALPEVPGFRLLRRLGAGSTGVVYLAVEAATERKVALKLFHAPSDRVSRSPLDIERERGVAAGLRQRNLARVHGIGRHGDQDWLACEYLAGGTLEERIARGLSIGAALAITRDLLRGLAHAHARGVVHGDVKPANILFRRSGEAVLADYGLASLTADPRTGPRGGTAGYMSPEQAAAQALDGRSDLYSTGVVLHEMLTGRPPRADTALPIDRVVGSLPRPARWLGPFLETLLAPDPDERPPDAGAALRLLANLQLTLPEAEALGGAGPVPGARQRVHGVAPVAPWARRRVWRLAAWLAAIGTVILLWWAWSAR